MEKQEIYMEPYDGSYCKRCHRKLKTAFAKEVGYGEVCYKKMLQRKRNYLFDLEVNNEVNR